MSSLKLDRHLETKTKEELKKDLSEELKRQKIWLVLTVVTSRSCCSSRASCCMLTAVKMSLF